jgi:hypothetical protein
MSSQAQKSKCVPWCHKSLSVVTAQHPVIKVTANIEQLFFTTNKIWKKSCPEINPYPANVEKIVSL